MDDSSDVVTCGVEPIDREEGSMYDPLKAKTRILVLAGTVFLLGIGIASGLGWTSASHAMPSIAGTPQVSAASVQPALDLSEAFTNLATAVTPAVVRIESRRTVPARTREEVPEQFRRFFDEQGGESAPPRSAISGGSGFIVSADGYILTNNHVVENATDLRVYFPDRRYYPARVIGADPFTDVAVIKVDVGTNLPSMAFGDSDDTRVGEWILAIGNPGFGNSTQLDFTVTAGIISARGRGLRLLQQDIINDPRYDRSLAGFAIEDFIQTDAVINPGNSGGPMVNLKGQVVGINSAIASTTGAYQGYGFAIPINLARRVMEDLVEYGHVKRPRIGVTIEDVVAEDADAYGLPAVSGILVQTVDASGPSAGALQQEDVIVELDGRPVGYVSELQAEIAERRPGDRVRLAVYRARQRIEVDVRLTEAPINNLPSVVAERPVLAEERLGIQVEAIDEQIADDTGYEVGSGVVLSDVARGSTAERRNVGTYRGMKLAQVNDMEIRSPEDLRRALDSVQPGQIVSLHFVDRVGDERVVNVRMP
jgi:serine protease Do